MLPATNQRIETSPNSSTLAKLPRRLSSLFRNLSMITTTATFYSSRRIARATPSRRAFASARLFKTRRTSSKCAVVPAIDRHVSSFLGSAPTRPRKFDVLISSPTSTTTPSAKICLRCSVVWISKTLALSNCACSPNPAPNLSPHLHRALPICRRAPTLVFVPICSSISPLTTSYRACAAHRFATTCALNVLVDASPVRNPFRWPKAAKFPAQPTIRRDQWQPHSTPYLRSRQILHTLPRQMPLIAECQCKCTPATQETRVVVTF